MISARYLPTLCVLIALACVPTVIHGYIGRTVRDGRLLQDLPMTLNGLGGRSTNRSPEWVSELYGTTDFIERQYGPALTLFVARSYDAKSLYHHPELGVAHGDAYDRAVIVRRSDRPEVPMYTLEAAQGYSVYALTYEGEFIEHPIRFQLQQALTLLFRPKAPVTLFFVRGKGSAPTPKSKALVEDLLLAALDSFANQPRANALR